MTIKGRKCHDVTFVKNEVEGNIQGGYRTLIVPGVYVGTQVGTVPVPELGPSPVPVPELGEFVPV